MGTARAKMRYRCFQVQVTPNASVRGDTPFLTGMTPCPQKTAYVKTISKFCFVSKSRKAPIQGQGVYRHSAKTCPGKPCNAHNISQLPQSPLERNQRKKTAGKQRCRGPGPARRKKKKKGRSGIHRWSISSY